MKKETEFNTQNQGDEIYLVTVTKTLMRTYKVRAKDISEAEKLIEEEYRKGNVVLNEECVNDTDFFCKRTYGRRFKSLS